MLLDLPAIQPGSGTLDVTAAIGRFPAVEALARSLLYDAASDGAGSRDSNDTAPAILGSLAASAALSMYPRLVGWDTLRQVQA